MNNLLSGGLLAAILFLLYRVGLGTLLNQSLEKTAKEDKSLEKQQLENQAKLAQVKREIKDLKDEHERLKDEPEGTDQEKADKWNKPPGQS